MTSSLMVPAVDTINLIIEIIGNLNKIIILSLSYFDRNFKISVTGKD
jgi:hypothetical protein